MKALTSLFALLCVLLSTPSFAAVPVQDLMDLGVPVNANGTAPKLEQVKLAIISACRKNGWTPSLSEEGKITASTLIKSTYYVEVEIPYTDKNYSIIYKNSRELGYDPMKRTIHKSYNKWVVMLSTAIQQEFGIPPSRFK